MKLTKKQLSITFIVLIVAIGATCAALSLFHHTPKPPSANIESEKKTIMLMEGKQLKTLKDNTAITGTYSIVKDQALFYTLTTPSSQLVGSGTILPDETGHFSRNLSVAGDDLKDGTSLVLRIYTQSSKGDIVDTLSVTSSYKR